MPIILAQESIYTYYMINAKCIEANYISKLTTLIVFKIVFIARFILIYKNFN